MNRKIKTPTCIVNSDTESCTVRSVIPWFLSGNTRFLMMPRRSYQKVFFPSCNVLGLVLANGFLIWEAELAKLLWLDKHMQHISSPVYFAKDPSNDSNSFAMILFLLDPTGWRVMWCPGGACLAERLLICAANAMNLMWCLFWEKTRSLHLCMV